MKPVGLTVSGVILISALAGCGTTSSKPAGTVVSPGAGSTTGNTGNTGGGQIGPIQSNHNGLTAKTTGYFIRGTFPEALVTQSGAATANFKTNSDHSVTVTEDIGSDAPTKTTYSCSACDAKDPDAYVSKLSDGTKSYMQVQGFSDSSIANGENVVAFIKVIGAHPGINHGIAARAYYSTEHQTKNMPNSGSANYEGRGQIFGGLDGGLRLGGDPTFYAHVNFDNASVEGSILGKLAKTEFDASIIGSKFVSNKDSIKFNGDFNRVDQTKSKIEGAFYGDGAKGIGGIYKVIGKNPARRKNVDISGTFTGQKK